jgi:hypothetical protein
MGRFRIAPFGLLLAAASVVVCAQNQPPSQSDSTAWHPAPEAHPISAPFPIKGKLPHTVEIRPASAVSAQDQQLEANEENSIREHAGVQLMDFTSTGWSYSQIACPAFPGHLFLRFTRTVGKGDVSAFTASIPRFGQGKDRIIPIQRRGYSLFSPAPINSMTIASFNHVLAEERASDEPEWAAIAVCYAALAGTGSEGTLAPIAMPILRLQKDGGATIIFATADPRAKDWTMVFDRHGVLKKATHTGVADYTFHPVPNQEKLVWPPDSGSGSPAPVTAQAPSPQQ